jgi:hypothetical protein
MDKTEQTKENYEVVNFYNIDNSEFRGMWGGEEYIIAPKENKKMVRFLAEHFAGHLANKILMKEGRDWGNDSPDKKQMVARILGKEEPATPMAAPENFQPTVSTSTAEMIVEKTEEFPDVPKEEPKEVKETKVYICDVCQKECKNALGLAAHKRSHKA